jgi:hypothetical protein
MSRHGSWGTVLVVGVSAVAVAGCKGNPKKRAEQVATAAEFWAEAPRPVASAGPREIRYRPENVKGYAMSIDVETPPGSRMVIDAKMTLALDFQAGTTPRSRDARIRLLELRASTGGKVTEMHLDRERVTVRSGPEPAATFKRGDPGPFDLAAMVDLPFHTLTFTEDNQVRLTANREHPFGALGGDMFDTALVLFPDLPNQPVTAGHKWTLQRNVPLGQGAGRVDVTYHFEYVGDSACPSGAGTCAQITLTASSKEVETEQGGFKMTIGYGFAGKVFFDLDKGSIDESRVRMDMDVKVLDEDVSVGGLFIAKPT